MANIEQTPRMNSAVIEPAQAVDPSEPVHQLRIDQAAITTKPPAQIWSMGWRAIIALALMAFIALLGWGLYQVQKKPLEQGLAPDFTLKGFDGHSYTLSQLRGKVVVINFWASWCPPCREEAPYLEQTWRKYKDQGVIFIGVDYVDTEKPALAYIKEFDITYFNGPDLGTRIAQSFNIKGVPETYYVAKDGTLRGNHIGPLQEPQLDQKIDELLAEPGPSK